MRRFANKRRPKNVVKMTKSVVNVWMKWLANNVSKKKKLNEEYNSVKVK